MKTTTMRLIAIVAAAASAHLATAADTAEVAAARGVIARFAGESVAASLELSLIPAENGRPVYEIDANGKTVRGSSAVAICHGFYSHVRSRGAGIASWSGNRFDAERAFAVDTYPATSGKVVRVVSPFEHHQYLNVVTYGYTMCYWDEERWMREFDWMALHGIDMPLLICGAEAVGERVWKRLGMRPDEYEPYFAGPIYLPWFLMGNLSERPNSQTRAWRERSVAMQRKLLGRARELGMTVIAPGFGGFVPKALTRVKPEAKLLEMTWSGSKKYSPFHNNLLSPDQPLFREIARIWVEEYESLFGKVDYYLADSFNEMSLPWKTNDEIVKALRHCGENIYGGMRDANADATWVMQGWMFFHAKKDWTTERIAALAATVPDDKMLILDMAADYIRYAGVGVPDNSCGPEGGISCWDLYDGFAGKGWLTGTIPNMGGDVDLTGPFEYYANGHLQALASPRRRNLRAWGLAPEGLENNEMVMEILTEAGWRDTYVDSRKWFRKYAESRYGKCPTALEDAFDELLPITYGEFRNHPFYTWQHAPKMCGWGRNPMRHTVRERDRWRRAIEFMRSSDAELALSPLWRADFAEFRMIALACEAEAVFLEEDRLHKDGRDGEAAPLREKLRSMILEMDAILKDHPLHRLDRWLDFARNAAGGDAKLENDYLCDARRIISIWGPPVEDYSARLWHGILKSYVLPRMEIYWKNRDLGRDGVHDLIVEFELKWVAGDEGADKK